MEEYMLAVLENTYKKNVLKQEGETEEITFPNDWYKIGLTDRINILDEAISKNIVIEETDCYKNMIPSDKYTQSK